MLGGREGRLITGQDSEGVGDFVTLVDRSPVPVLGMYLPVPEMPKSWSLLETSKNHRQEPWSCCSVPASSLDLTRPSWTQ
jgi:hypothetical protein